MLAGACMFGSTASLPWQCSKPTRVRLIPLAYASVQSSINALHRAPQVRRRDALAVHCPCRPSQRKRQTLKQLHRKHKPGAGHEGKGLRAGAGYAGERDVWWEPWGCRELLEKDCSSMTVGRPKPPPLTR